MTLENLGADVSLLVPLPIDLLKRYVNLFIRTVGPAFKNREVRTVTTGVSGSMQFIIAGSCIKHDTENGYWANNGFVEGDTIHVSGSVSCDGDYIVDSVGGYGTPSHSGTSLVLTVAPPANETTSGVHVVSDTLLSQITLPPDVLSVLDVRINGSLIAQNDTDTPDETGTRCGWTLRGRKVFLDAPTEVDDTVEMQVYYSWPQIDWDAWLADDSLGIPEEYYILALHFIVKSCSQFGEYKNDLLYREHSVAYEKELAGLPTPSGMTRMRMSFGDGL
jgi:hypothetical protein